jgi:hypothetical protein
MKRRLRGRQLIGSVGRAGFKSERLTDEVFNPMRFQSHKKSGHFPKTLYPCLNPKKLSLPVNFIPSLNLLEMAMKTSHPKVLRVKPPRDDFTLLEAFVFGRRTKNAT